jgi:hypothetical protein
LILDGFQLNAQSQHCLLGVSSIKLQKKLPCCSICALFKPQNHHFFWERCANSKLLHCSRCFVTLFVMFQSVFHSCPVSINFHLPLTCMWPSSFFISVQKPHLPDLPNWIRRTFSEEKSNG